jgi:rifampicin phosphotransferase
MAPLHERTGRIALGLVVSPLLATPALAIPSPELVIGSVASLSQFFAFGTALVGGGAIFAGRRAGVMQNAGARLSRGLLVSALVLLTVAVALTGLNLYQYQTAKQVRLTRLQATLNRPAVIRDANLRETSFTAQSRDPLGISTGDATRALTSGEDILFVDVRESAENLMGTIPGAQHIRFPDVKPSDPRFKGRKVILLCQNGNRSSEVCNRLAALGIDCKFIVGGIEKWIVEGRPFTDKSVRTLADLRAIPTYANKDTLLDTPDIKDLIATQDVQFVDLRYPGDFATGHLPGAIDFPLRAMPTAEIAGRIAALPKKPIVAACYDRRGCFMSQVLGYELVKAGYDYRGRYTVPWEYFVPRATKPHIAKWLAEANRSYWQRTIDALTAALVWLGAQSNFLFAVFALALTTRLVILPVAIKAERDQIVTTRVAPEMTALKQRFRGNGAGKADALKQHYAKHGLSPGRNLLALVFLPVTMLGISAVQRAASGQPGVAWVSNLALPDPTYLMPALATVLGCLYLQLAMGSTRRKAILSWVIGAPLLAALTSRLNAAGVIYLIFALALLFVQRAYVTGLLGGWLRALGRAVRAAQVAVFHGGVIPLRYTNLLADAGNKAYRLSRLLGAGFSVPDGVVLTHRYLQRFRAAPPEQQARMARNIAARFGENLMAVRSSATGEDGDNLSFAGVFESRLDVSDAQLGAAILDVLASFDAAHTQAYADAGQGNILIQRMVRPDFAGVLFTTDPAHPGIAVAEFVKGNAEDLVSGRVVPTTCRFGRNSLALLDGDAPVDFAPLLQMGHKIETLFEGPQDIEWTCRAGQFEIVQSRNITTLDDLPSDPVSQEWRRLMARAIGKDAGAPLFAQDEMAEVLPMPSPLSLSYMQALWARDGSVGMACARLGVAYRPDPSGSHLTTVFARLYSDVQRKAATAVSISRSARKRLEKAPMAVADHYRSAFIPRLDQRMSELSAMHYDTIEQTALVQVVLDLFDEFTCDIHVEVEVINIAAGYFVQRAIGACDAAGLDAGGLIASDGGVTPAGLLKFVDVNDSEKRKEILRAHFGHRAVHDYELSAPRYREDEAALDTLLLGADMGGTAAARTSQTPDVPADLLPILHAARTYQSLKDAAKHQALRHLAEIRRALTALDDKMAWGGLVHYLKLAELRDLTASGEASVDAMRDIAAARRADQDALAANPALPATLNAATLERASLGVAAAATGDGLLGKRVSGDQRAVGPVYLVSRERAEAGARLQGFKPGDILVCSYVHPNWLPFVLMSGGVIAEVGGWLSHIAIVARENNIPLVVGVSGWEALGDTDEVAIEIDGSIEPLMTVPQEGSVVVQKRSASATG